MLMRHWLDDPHRPTRDIDLPGFGDSNPELTLKLFREICAVEAGDAVIFDADALVVDQGRDESGLPWGECCLFNIWNGLFSLSCRNADSRRTIYKS
jgi:hypothetical protein